MPDIQQYSVSIKFKTEGSEKATKDVDKVKDSVNKLKGSKNATSKISDTLGKIGTFAGGAVTAISALATAGGAGLVKLGQSMFGLAQQTSDYIETVNLFRTSMGDAADQAQEFIDKAESMLGLDPKSMMDSISSFQNLSEGFGIASDRAYTMSQNLTQLSADLSSLANISFEDAQKKVMSGFSGQIQPLRKYGVALDQASLQETAYSLGIEQKVKSMTKAQKTELIYYQIMKSTQKMQGDLGKSLLSPANATRVLQTEFQKLARAVGSIFIPGMMRIIPAVRAVTQVLTQAAEAIAELFGFKMSDYEADLSSVGNLLEGVSDGIEDMGDSAEGTAKDLNKMLMSFDELNNLTSNNGSGSGSGVGVGVGGSLGIDLPQYDMFASIDDSIKNRIENGDWYDIGKTIGEKLTEGLKKIPWSIIQSQTNGIAENIAKFLNGSIQNTDWNLVGGTFAEALNTIFGFAKTFVTTTDFSGIGKAIGNTISGFFEKVKWEDVGTTLSGGVEGALDVMLGAMSTFDQNKVSDSIAKIFNNVDWTQVLLKAAKFVVQGIKYSPIVMLIKGQLELIENLINVAVEWSNQYLGTSFKKVHIDVDKAIDGITNSIFDGLIETNSGIKEHSAQAVEDIGKSADSIEKSVESGSKNSYTKAHEYLSKINVDTKKQLDLADDLQKTGQKNAEAYGLGLQNKQPFISKVNEFLKNQTIGGLDAKSESYDAGVDVVFNYSEGLGSYRSTIALSESTSWIERTVKSGLDKKNQAWTWGYDMVQGLKQGILAGQNLIQRAVDNVTNIIWSSLHCSRPEEGPLRDYETWMPDMIKGLSDSLLRSLPMLESAVAEVSDVMAENLQLPSMFIDGQTSAEIISNIRSKSTVTADVQTASTIANATYSAVSRALLDSRSSEKDRLIQVNIGNKEVYRGYGQYKDEQSNMLGINVG